MISSSSISLKLLFFLSVLSFGAVVKPTVWGNCANYAIHAGTAVSFSGARTLVTTGDVGVASGAAITGSYRVTESVDINNANAISCLNDKIPTFKYLNSFPCTTTLPSGDLSKLKLTPGVYCSASGAFTISASTLTLDGGGNPNAVWIFQTDTTLITASSTSFILTNGAQPLNVYWVVGTSATLGSYSSFTGQITAAVSITMGSGAVANGRLIARAAITFSSNGNIQLPLTSPTGINPATIWGTCEPFAVHASATDTFDGPQTTVKCGDVGVSPGTSITGDYKLLGGTVEPNTPSAVDCSLDKASTLVMLQSVPCPVPFASPDLANLVLPPGVYCATPGFFTISAGTLTLDAGGNYDAIWIFNTESTVVTASYTKVVLINGAQPQNVFWVVGSSATLGSYSTFVGGITARASVTVNTGVMLFGRAMAGAAVTFAGGATVQLSNCGTPGFSGNFQMTSASGGPCYTTGSLQWSWTQNMMVLNFGAALTETYKWNPSNGYSPADTTPQYLFSSGASCDTCNVGSITTGMPPLNPALVGTFLSPPSGIRCTLCPGCQTYTPSQPGSFLGSMQANGSQVCGFTLTDGRSFVLSEGFTPTVPIITPPSSGCACSQAIDVQFLVDHSASISDAQMTQFIIFVKSFIGNLTISPTQVNVGMSYFSQGVSTTSTPYIGTNFPMTGDLAAVTAGMNGWKSPCTKNSYQCQFAATATAAGVQFAAKQLFTSTRPVPKILITLTDGAANRDLKNAECCFESCSPSIITAMSGAIALSNSYSYAHTMTFLAVGIGTECSTSNIKSCSPLCKYTPHLLRLANNISSNVLNINSFSSLNGYVQQLTALTCTTTSNLAQTSCLQTCAGVCACGVCTPPTTCLNDNICETYAVVSGSIVTTPIPITSSCPGPNKCSLPSCAANIGLKGTCTFVPVDCSGVTSTCACQKYSCSPSAGSCSVFNNSACLPPVDCAYSQWASWSACTVSCGGGTATTKRTIATQPANCGNPCTGVTTQSQSCQTQICPTDCVWSGWNAWGSCSSTCGSGTQTQSRSVLTPAANGGIECDPTTSSLSQTCTIKPCPIDCVWYPWSAWSSCSATCGNGQKTSSRSIQINAGNGGVDCIGSSNQITTCNVVDCPIDCVWNPWNAYAACTLTCGNGTSTRPRTVNVSAANGGAPCGSVSSDTQPCNTQPCPVPCAWSIWSLWTSASCSVSCGGGDQTTLRTITQQGINGATPCNTSDASRSQTCNNQPCPINCVWNSWSGYFPCSVTCGTGIQFSNRSVNVSAANGGQACGSVNLQNQTCNINPCPINCVWNVWAAWSDCSVTCGSGSQTSSRTVLTPGQYGGIACNTSDNIMSKPGCSSNGCPVDCIWSVWGAYGDCSVTCGGGSQTQNRTITTPSANAGAACGTTNVSIQSCNPQGCPVDCQGSWSSWSACDCNNLKQSRSYAVTVPSANGGQNCPQNTGDNQTQGTAQGVCTTTPSCAPIDCTGTWGVWSDCSCATNTTSRLFSITTPAVNNGKECNFSNGATDTKVCDPTGCPVDCIGAFGPFGNCSCTSNTKTQTYIITRQLLRGGSSCPYSNETNNVTSCIPSGCPVDCVGSWSAYGDCSCTNNSQTRVYTVSTSVANGGTSCPVPDGNISTNGCLPVNCPVDCIGAWSSFATCDCVTKNHNQTFKISTNASFSGAPCVATDNQVNTTSCTPTGCPVDCVGSWSAYGNCDCDSHFNTRTFTVTTGSLNGGKGCVANDGSVDSSSCIPTGCPVNCVGSWGSWKICDCETDSQNRTFTVETALKNGGAPCLADDQSVDERKCTPSGCRVDCNGSYSGYSQCDCISKTQSHTFSITIYAQNGGTECNATQGSVESTSCTPPVTCPQDCVGEWTLWSACNCSSHSAIRSMNITTNALNGGVECPGQQSSSCVPTKCPVDCQGFWSSWSSCPCGTNPIHTRNYTETSPAVNDGAPCDQSAEASEDCSPTNCPSPCVGKWEPWGACNCTTKQETSTFNVISNATNGGALCVAGHGTLKDQPCVPVNCHKYGPSCNTAADCNDNQPCTTDQCLVFPDGTYHCDWATPTNCSDGSICTSDICDPQLGCQNPLILICDDFSNCTVDSCDPISGCKHTNVTCPNSTSRCYLSVCDEVLGCGQVQKTCPPSNSTDNCTLSICSVNATTKSGCEDIQLCDFQFPLVAGLAIGAVIGVAVACSFVALVLASGGSFAIATQTGALVDTMTQANPLYTNDGVAGTNTLFGDA